MDKIVTFVILAYNVEQYLKKCLDSFLCEPVMDRIEVLIIDDGSKDTTGQIAQSYARNYPDTFRVYHKANGGHGSGINAGSAMARGKYFKAIDADDWVITEKLPAYVEFLEQSSTDVVLTYFHMVDMTTGKKTAKTVAFPAAEALTVRQIMENWSDFEPCCVFHGITYRTDFYRRKAHMLPEHVFYEDQEYSAIPFCAAERVGVLPVFLYQYLVGNAAQSISYENQARRIGHLETVLQDLIGYYHARSDASQTERDFLCGKIESVSLICFLTAFLYEKDKRRGRTSGDTINRLLAREVPVIHGRLQKKYNLFRLMNYLHISPEMYRKVIESSVYTGLKSKKKYAGQ